jgi:hypothetical protein
MGSTLDMAVWGVLIVLLILARRQSADLGRKQLLALKRLATQEEGANIEELIAHSFCVLQADPELFPIDRGNLGDGWYIKPRSIAWWDSFQRNADAKRWAKLIRVSKPTFQYLVLQLSPALETEVPWAFRNIPNRVLTVDRQLAIALHHLATGNSAFTVSELFGVSEDTVYSVTKKVCKALWDVLKPAHLIWPTSVDAVARVSQGFEERKGLPNCLGAIDCTHFLIDLPEHEASSCWFDRDHNYSMIMQAVVDAEGKFLDVCIGWPGSVHDTRVFKNSQLYHNVENGIWLNGEPKLISGCQVPQYIVGDAGYPHLAWLLVPYPGMELPDVKDRFNYFQSVTRIIVEMAFGRLKGIWRILFRRMVKPDIKTLPTLIGACAVLHNIMLERGDLVDERLIPLPEEVQNGACPRLARTGNHDADVIRDALAEYSFTNL